MFDIILYTVIWCLCIYGIISILQDINRANTYKKIEENVKLIMTVKNVEDGIENYIREILFGKNFYNNLVVIDMDSTDDTLCILKELEQENVNMKILTKEEGKEYLKNLN